MQLTGGGRRAASGGGATGARAAATARARTAPALRNCARPRRAAHIVAAAGAHVCVVGGGVVGLTSALRLLQV